MGAADEDAWAAAIVRDGIVRRPVHDLENVRRRDGGRHVDTPEHRRAASRMAAARAEALRRIRQPIQR